MAKSTKTFVTSINGMANKITSITPAKMENGSIKCKKQHEMEGINFFYYLQ